MKPVEQFESQPVRSEGRQGFDQGKKSRVDYGHRLIPFQCKEP